MHIFFIDPLEKLNLKKDSTLMMALTFQAQGIESYVLFEKDFSIANDTKDVLDVYSFKGAFKEDGFYLDSFELAERKQIQLSANDFIHMRIDPPYDSRYQRYLWMLDFLVQRTGVEVLNSPTKIMKYNEKLVALKDLSHSHPSFIGSSKHLFEQFINRLKPNYDEVILKPLDLYSGIGVEKVSINNELTEKFEKKVKDFQGAIVCQPFIKDVYNGELRSVYFDGQELGTIIKKPNPGEFLANIAQGAKYEQYQLAGELKVLCDRLAQELYADGVRFIAFDLLGGAVNEINITCPGLLVEVSYACKKNLAQQIAMHF